MSKNTIFLLIGLAVFAVVIAAFLIFPWPPDDGETDETESANHLSEKSKPADYGEAINSLASISIPFDSTKLPEELMAEMDDAQFVLLGESSHGTAEYYSIRTEITKKLIAEKDFSFIAVEGDWPNIYHINRYVKGYAEAKNEGREALLAGARWPEWMWANNEFLELVNWLRDFNENLPQKERIGLYGIDMQDLSASLEAATASLEEADPDLASSVNEKYNTLQPYAQDLIKYVEAYAYEGISCEYDVWAALDKINNEYGRDKIFSSHELFDIKQNMLAVQYAEAYGRAIAYGGPASWNIRSDYMKRTIGNLSEHYGEGSKGIIWAHNTHVGDARATDMKEAGKVNIGQLLRENRGEESVYIVGLGSDRGEVKAGRQWDYPGEVKDLPPAAAGSFEYLLAQIDKPSFLLLFDKKEELPEVLAKPLNHRAKGVVYHPGEDEAYYVPTIIPRRYNAFIFIEETGALKTLR